MGSGAGSWIWLGHLCPNTHPASRRRRRWMGRWVTTWLDGFSGLWVRPLSLAAVIGMVAL